MQEFFDQSSISAMEGFDLLIKGLSKSNNLLAGKQYSVP
jgi:hypothetical protein